MPIRLGVSRRSLVSALLFAAGCGSPASSVPPDVRIQRALAADVARRGGDSTLHAVELTPEEVRATIRDNLDPRLLASATRTGGKSFRFAEVRQHVEEQVGVLSIDYPDSGTARRMSEVLVDRKGYFAGTPILTPFSSVPVRNQLVIAFTENAGDQAVVNFVRGVPHLLGTAP
jgi:hypothetical protein